MELRKDRSSSTSETNDDLGISASSTLLTAMHPRRAQFDKLAEAALSGNFAGGRARVNLRLHRKVLTLSD